MEFPIDEHIAQPNSMSRSQISSDAGDHSRSTKTKAMHVQPQALSRRRGHPSLQSPCLSGIPSWLGYQPPGRLGNPHRELYQDPRVHPRLLRAMAEYGLDRNQGSQILTSLSPTPSWAELVASMTRYEKKFQHLCGSMENDLPSDEMEIETECRTDVIPGYDGNFIELIIHRPVLRGGPLPCILYIPGGSGVNKTHRRWCTSLAASGMVSILINYRNPRDTQFGFHPFPAASNDVCAAIHHIYSRRDHLDLLNIVLQGDGFGSNIVLSAAIRARRENWINKIDGVYACCPFISNGLVWAEEAKLRDLPSFIECSGYGTSADYMAYMAHIYTPQIEDHNNPLAWPYYASIDDLTGLPPHVLSMDELDPLRDEGIIYTRKLIEAGVQAVGHVNTGVVHAASLIYRKALPELHKHVIRNIAAFAKSV